MRGALKVACFVVVVGGAVALSQCFNTRVTDPKARAAEYMKGEVRLIMPHSVPPHGTATDMEEVHDATFDGVAWEVSAPITWKDYRQWLAVLLSDFSMLASSHSDAFLSKRLPGDVHQLAITVVSAGPPLRVRLRFRAFPD